MDDSAGTSGTPEQPRKRQRCDTDTDYMQLMQQHVQQQQRQQQQQQQQQQHQQQQQPQQQQPQQPNAFCGPGPANNFGPVPANNFGPGPANNFGPVPANNFGPGPANNFGPVPANNFGPGPANNFGPVPANNFGPGPANNFGPGLANNFQAFMHQALQAQQAQFNAFCQQMSLTGPVATMMQHMQQLARFPMPGPPPPQPPPPPPPPGAPQWSQQRQHLNGMSQQPWQLKRSRRPKKGQAMVQKPGAQQGPRPNVPQGQKPMPPKVAQGQPQAQTSFGKKRCVATWTCYEPDGPPRSYVSDKKWSSQRKVRVCDAEGQCPFPFQGRTVSDFVLLGPQTVMPPQPQSRYCDVCGGLVLNELRHKESRKHREAMELDVALICARIRRDPAFAAAVISAARECIETTGVVEEADSDNSDMSLVDEEDDDDYDDVDDDGGDKYKDDDELLAGKKGSDKPSNQQPSRAVASSSTDDFGFLENEVFRRAPDGNNLKGGQEK